MFNDNVEERYALAIERIKEIAEEPGLKTDGFADISNVLPHLSLRWISLRLT